MNSLMKALGDWEDESEIKKPDYLNKEVLGTDTGAEKAMEIIRKAIEDGKLTIPSMERSDTLYIGELPSLKIDHTPEFNAPDDWGISPGKYILTPGTLERRVVWEPVYREPNYQEIARSELEQTALASYRDKEWDEIIKQSLRILDENLYGVELAQKLAEEKERLIEQGLGATLDKLSKIYLWDEIDGEDD